MGNRDKTVIFSQRDRSAVRDQSGASLIEVMVMAGAMLVMMLSFMSLMGNSAKNVSYLEDRLSRVSLENELRVEFSGENFCKDLLSGVVAPLTGQSKDLGGVLNQAEQLAALNQIFQKRGEAFFYDQLEVKKIALESSNLSGPGTSGALILAVYPERFRQGGGPSSMRPVKIKTAVSLDSDGKISSCRAEDDQGKSCSVADLKAAPQWQVGVSCFQEYVAQDLVSSCSAIYFELDSTKIITPAKAKSRFPSGSLVLIQGTWKAKKSLSLGHSPFTVQALMTAVPSGPSVSALGGHPVYESVKHLQASCQDGVWSWIGADAASGEAMSGTAVGTATAQTIRCIGSYCGGFTWGW